jgi:pathogenesis-related protein 1
MRTLRFIIVCSLATSCSGSDGSASLEEPMELSGITAAHNQVRADVGVGPMQWDPALANLAAGFISDCVFAHSSGPERMNVAGYSYVGENLYASGGFAPTGVAVSDAWASEKAMYNYASNGCSGTCGHYTQQVWRASTKLGCAVKSCAGGMYIVSCEYGPGGNYNGQKPY